MRYLLLFVATWTISQTVKFFLRWLRDRRGHLGQALWVYQWASGMPSTHATILTVFVFLVGRSDHFGPLFGFAAAIAALLVYDLLAERHKQKIFDSYAATSREPSMQHIASDGKLLDITGHSFTDIIGGVVLGLLIIVFLSKLPVF